MSLPWSAAQVEWLREMGFDVLARRAPAVAPVAGPVDDAPPSEGGFPACLQRAARGVDLAPLLAAGIPRDPAARRAFWRALRPLRRAAGAA